MAITPLPLPQPGDTNWAGPLNASLEQLNRNVGEISETGQDILDAADVAQQSATDAEAAAVRAEAVPAQVDTAMAEQVGTGGEFDAKLNATIAGSPRTFTAAQTFDTGDGTSPIRLDPDASRNWNTRSEIASIGPDLILRRHDGNAGQRLALTGRAGMAPEVMPYFEVVAATRTGSDGGNAVAGYQLHLGPDDGAGNNREMMVWEAVGENDPEGPHFRIGVHASGTGVRRPYYLKGGDAKAFKFDSSGHVTAYQPLEWKGDHSTIIKTYRVGGNQTSLHTTVYSDIAGAVPSVFFGHSGGTKDAPSAPGAGWTLGSQQFGAVNGPNTVVSAQIRAVTTQAWTFGSAQGSRLEFLIQRQGTASTVEGLRVYDPAANQAGIMVLVNRAGVVTTSQVTIGDIDSAGVGYRQLRVAN